MLGPEARISDNPVDRKPPAISDYELIRRIGSGAYGEVWLARGVTGVLRAVKLVRRDRFGSAEPFEREFRGLKEFAAISLVAANQLALLHIGQNHEVGFFYYVMELADDINTGRDIDIETYSPCTLQALQRKKNRLTTEEAVNIGVELARGLASLHSHGLIHRDIKPANIIFVGGTPKLADIGLVTAAELGQSIIGTEGFIAPEGPGTPSADVYSAGKVLYELNTGLDRKEFPVLPHMDRASRRRFLDLNEVVLQACESDARRRYQDAEALLDDLLKLQGGRGLLRKRVTRWLSPVLFRVAVAVAVLASAAAGAWLWPRISPNRPHVLDASVSPRSIAVLPFESLSADPNDAFFADGIHEDVISRIAKIHDLKVISRTSVLDYRGEHKVKEIAARLGVANIVEGTVRRDGSQVSVTIRLIDARTNRRRWESEYFKENLAGVLGGQNLLAQEIATALRAKLTPTERELIARRPTTNPRAYDLYLKARSTFQQVGWSDLEAKEAYAQVVDLCEKATDEDPSFTEAFVQLALAHSALCRFSVFNPSSDELVKAKRAANSATGWQPNLPEVRLARGVVRYLDHKDWPGALDEFTDAEIDLPNDDQLQWWKGNVFRRLGRWEDAIRCFERAAVLNPRVPDGAANQIQTLRFLRRFEEALSRAKVHASLVSESRRLYEEEAICKLEMDGNRAAFLRALDHMPEDRRPPGEIVLITREYESAYRREDWEAAERALTKEPLKSVAEFPTVLAAPVGLHRALVAFLADRLDDSRKFAQQALDESNAAAEKWNDRERPWGLMVQARAHALLGQAEKALAASDSAWKLIIDAGDKILALPMMTRRGEVLILLGRKDAALAVLSEMMKRPADMGPQALRISPLWRRLAGDPRFEEILRRAKPIDNSSSDNSIPPGK